MMKMTVYMATFGVNVLKELWECLLMLHFVKSAINKYIRMHILHYRFEFIPCNSLNIRNINLIFTLIKSTKYDLRILFTFPNLLTLWAWNWVSELNFKYLLNAFGKYNMHNCTTPLNTKWYFNYWNRKYLFNIMFSWILKNQPAPPSTLYCRDSGSADSATVCNAAWKASTAHLIVFNDLKNYNIQTMHIKHIYMNTIVLTYLSFWISSCHVFNNCKVSFFLSFISSSWSIS